MRVKTGAMVLKKTVVLLTAAFFVFVGVALMRWNDQSTSMLSLWRTGAFSFPQNSVV